MSIQNSQACCLKNASCLYKHSNEVFLLFTTFPEEKEKFVEYMEERWGSSRFKGGMRARQAVAISLLSIMLWYFFIPREEKVTEEPKLASNTKVIFLTYMSRIISFLYANKIIVLF